MTDQPTSPVQSTINIGTEMERSYLDYAMSVIVSRALPDVRDGLKPVHRRVLYAQHDLSNSWNRAYKKSARVVGDVIGKYHPHGDQAVYDALVRMAQDFSMRLPLEDGQGNFGSMDGDKAAAMRYTEVRMARAASALLEDIEKETVDFQPNYDGAESEPTVLPARFPNVLVNGSAGIAVGMATNIPPHNLSEVIDATVKLVDAPETTIEELCEIVQGPDFPTGGEVIGLAGMKQALMTGRGSVVVRAKSTTEEVNGRQAIVVTEIPYQVNKAKLVERIAELVRDKIVEGISDLRDESDRFGVRVVIELRKDANAEVVLSQLYKHTPLQTSFGYNMMALDQGRPRLLNLRDILQCFIAHREEVITRRTRFDLRKARDRAHVLVGLATAVANIDPIIELIRHAPDAATAKSQLMGKAWNAETVLPLIELMGDRVTGDNLYQLSEIQAQAILDLRLQRLTGLERDKINAEADEIAVLIKDLVDILSDRTRLLTVMKDELAAVKEQFGTDRMTVVSDGSATVDLEDLIAPEDMVVTISTDGYVKRQRIDDYRAQRRGGKGRSIANMKGEEEEIQTFFVANTHEPLLFFTTTGKVYKLKVYELPLGSPGARGKAFVNLLPLEKGELVVRVLPLPRDEAEWEGQVALFATANGLIRKTPLTAFANVHSGGIKGMALNDGDELVSVRISPEAEGDVIMSSFNGQAVRFSVESLRTIQSRTALGVKGMTLKSAKDRVISMEVIQDGEVSDILTVTENGFGKRTPVSDYPAKSRGTMGVIAIKTTDRNGGVVAALPVNDEDQVMMATSDGQVIRLKVDSISSMSRNTQGVTLFRVAGKHKVSLVARISAEMLATADEVAEGEDGEIAPEIAAETAEQATETNADA